MYYRVLSLSECCCKFVHASGRVCGGGGGGRVGRQGTWGGGGGGKRERDQ